MSRRGYERGKGTLRVDGAASDELVPLDAHRYLPGHRVDMSKKHDVRRPVTDDTDLLGDNRQPVESFEACEDHALGGCVDRRRLVATHPGTDHRLAVGALRQLGEHTAHVLDRSAAEGQPLSQAGGRAGPT